MSSAQRIWMGMILAVFSLWGVWFVSTENSEKVLKQWQEIQAERFMDKIAQTGSCTWEDIRTLHLALNTSKVTSWIRLEEYKKEMDNGEKTFYTLISWTEISEQLVEKSYEFEKQSVVKLCVSVKAKYGSKEYEYYVIVE